MKPKRRFYPDILPPLAVLALIFDSKTAIAGGAEGVMLCLKSVIPSLFPFFVLTPLLIKSLLRHGQGIFRPLARLLRLSPARIPYLIAGFLGGYPVGAKEIRDAYVEKRLSRKDAERLLCFCCNAGPAFLFGICGGLFASRWTPWLLWAIHIFSAILTGLLTPGPCGETPMTASEETSLASAFQGALRAIGSVCGWVILFKVFLAIAEKWALWLLPEPVQILLTGILELTNGCLRLSRIPSEDMRFVMCSGFLSFGGLCVWMQTASVVRPLGIKSYACGKAMQTVLSIALAFLYVKKLFWLIVPVLLPVVFLLRKNNSSFFRKIPV